MFSYFSFYLGNIIVHMVTNCETHKSGNAYENFRRAFTFPRI